MKALSLTILLSGITLLLAGCVEPEATQEPRTAPLAPTASPNPAFTPSSEPWRPSPLPTATASERAAVGDTWVYLTAFQNDFVSVVDPVSGHALHQIPVDACQAGMAVSLDGTRLYVVDGMPASDGQLRVFDTGTWDVLHVEPVPDRSRLLGGNPISLSPDGRWLIVGFFNYDRRVGWERVFDTQGLRFLPDGAWPLGDCGNTVQLVGQPEDNGVYVQCHDFIAALSSDALSPRWRAPSPNHSNRDRFGWTVVGHSALAVSPDGGRLYGLYPLEERIHSGSRTPVIRTDLGIISWDTKDGRKMRDVLMSEQASVPVGSSSGGDEAVLVFSRDGKRLFALWHDMMWTLDPMTLEVEDVLKLPSPVLGAALSIDGSELYLLPNATGHLVRRPSGVLTVDVTKMEVIRQATDWPRLRRPFFYAAPASNLR